MADPPPVTPKATTPPAETPATPTPEAPAQEPAKKPGLLQRMAEQLQKGVQSIAADAFAPVAQAVVQGTTEIAGDITKVRPTDRIKELPRGVFDKIPALSLPTTTIQTGLGDQIDRRLETSRKEIVKAIETTYTVMKTRVYSLQESVKVTDKNIKVVDTRTKRFQEESEKTLAILQRQLKKMEAGQQATDQKFKKIDIPEKKADATMAGGFGLIGALLTSGITAAQIAALAGALSAGLTGALVLSIVGLLKFAEGRKDKPKDWSGKYYIGPPADTPQGKKYIEDLKGSVDLGAIIYGRPPRPEYSQEKTEWWKKWGGGAASFGAGAASGAMMAIPGYGAARALRNLGGWFMGGTPAGATERPGPIGSPRQSIMRQPQTGVGPGGGLGVPLYGGWGQQAPAAPGQRWIGAPGAATYGISPRGGGAMPGGSADVGGMVGQPAARAPVTGDFSRYLQQQYGGGAAARDIAPSIIPPVAPTVIPSVAPGGVYAPGIEAAREQILAQPPSPFFGPRAPGLPERPGVFGYVGQEPGMITGQGVGATGGWGGIFGGGASGLGGGARPSGFTGGVSGGDQPRGLGGGARPGGAPPRSPAGTRTRAAKSPRQPYTYRQCRYQRPQI